jgi:lysozyme
MGINSYRTTSPEGRDAIKNYESFRTNAYQDGGGVWTIGFGTTRYADGTKVKPGDKITPEEAEAAFAADLAAHEQQIKDINMNLTQPQFDALASLTYNLGPAAFDKYPSLGEAIANNDKEALLAAFDKFTYDNGQQVKGLANRRNAEQAMFTSPLDIAQSPEARPSLAQPQMDLVAGEAGPQVTALQQKLNELGYSVTVDGVYGEETKKAVETVQAQLGLSPTGGAIADVATLNAIDTQGPVAPMVAPEEALVAVNAPDPLAVGIAAPAPNAPFGFEQQMAELGLPAGAPVPAMETLTAYTGAPDPATLGPAPDTSLPAPVADFADAIRTRVPEMTMGTPVPAPSPLSPVSSVQATPVGPAPSAAVVAATAAAPVDAPAPLSGLDPAASIMGSPAPAAMAGTEVPSLDPTAGAPAPTPSSSVLSSFAPSVASPNRGPLGALSQPDSLDAQPAPGAPAPAPTAETLGAFNSRMDSRVEKLGLAGDQLRAEHEKMFSQPAPTTTPGAPAPSAAVTNSFNSQTSPAAGALGAMDPVSDITAMTDPNMGTMPAAPATAAPAPSAAVMSSGTSTAWGGQEAPAEGPSTGGMPTGDQAASLAEFTEQMDANMAGLQDKVDDVKVDQFGLFGGVSQPGAPVTGPIDTPAPVAAEGPGMQLTAIDAPDPVDAPAPSNPVDAPAGIMGAAAPAPSSPVGPAASLVGTEVSAPEAPTPTAPAPSAEVIGDNPGYTPGPSPDFSAPSSPSPDPGVVDDVVADTPLAADMAGPAVPGLDTAAAAAATSLAGMPSAAPTPSAAVLSTPTESISATPASPDFGPEAPAPGSFTVDTGLAPKGDLPAGLLADAPAPAPAPAQVEAPALAATPGPASLPGAPAAATPDERLSRMPTAPAAEVELVDDDAPTPQVAPAPAAPAPTEVGPITMDTAPAVTGPGAPPAPAVTKVAPETPAAPNPAPEPSVAPAAPAPAVPDETVAPAPSPDVVKGPLPSGIKEVLGPAPAGGKIGLGAPIGTQDAMRGIAGFAAGGPLGALISALGPRVVGSLINAFQGGPAAAGPAPSPEAVAAALAAAGMSATQAGPSSAIGGGWRVTNSDGVSAGYGTGGYGAGGEHGGLGGLSGPNAGSGMGGTATGMGATTDTGGHRGSSGMGAIGSMD